MRPKIIQSEDLLISIQKNIPVYDNLAKRVGTVKYVQFADDTVDENMMVDDARVQKAPAPLRTRLLKTGFIRIDTGLLSRDCYALADQISDVSDRGVELMASRSKLITL